VRTDVVVDVDAVLGCAGRNKVKTGSNRTASDDENGAEQSLLVPGMQDTHPALVSGPGARVVIHSQDAMPHPTADGYDVPAEFSVTIGVSARENVRVSQPHGNCTSDDRPPTASRSDYRSVLRRKRRFCIRYQGHLREILSMLVLFTL